MRYPGEDFDEYADRLHDERVQEEVDDRRMAANTTTETLRLREALADGARAGSAGLAPSLNPHRLGTPEHGEWHRGWSNATAANLKRRRAA